MSRELDAVLDTIPRLAESERKALAVVLVDWLGDGSTEDELNEAWRAEIARREEEIRTGKAKLVPWEEVQAELHDALHARRVARRKRFDRITFDPDTLNGQACIRGMRCPSPACSRRSRRTATSRESERSIPSSK